MVWFKVDDNLAFHTKALRAGNAAMGLWVRAGSWCAQQLTDGVVPDEILPSLGTRREANALVAAGLWTRGERSFAFHQWNDEGRQPTKESVLAERAANAARQRKHKEKRAAETRESSVSNAVSDTVTNDEVTPAVTAPRPDPTRPDPSTSFEVEKTSPSEAGASDDEFSEEVRLICEHLIARIRQNGNEKPKQPLAVTKTWLVAADRLLRIDGYTAEQVHWIIDWCQQDSFWKANVLSLVTLRKQFTTLKARALAEREEKKPAGKASQRTQDALELIRRQREEAYNGEVRGNAAAALGIARG